MKEATDHPIGAWDDFTIKTMGVIFLILFVGFPIFIFVAKLNKWID